MFSTTFKICFLIVLSTIASSELLNDEKVLFYDFKIPHNYGWKGLEDWRIENPDIRNKLELRGIPPTPQSKSPLKLK